MLRLILASASPTRAKLLKQAGFDFDIISTDIDEDTVKNEITDPETLVKTLAQQKGIACQRLLASPSIIITADTVVVFGDEIIGKPTDRIDAKRIIQKLSGHTHHIWTGVAVNEAVFAEKSEVTIKKMSEEEINAYLDTDEWVGKAGGYQLQKTISRYVTKIEGSYSNILGLPLIQIVTNLKKLD